MSELNELMDRITKCDRRDIDVLIYEMRKHRGVKAKKAEKGEVSLQLVMDIAKLDKPKEPTGFKRRI